MPKPVQASTYTFRKIIEGGFLYVDKTKYIYELDSCSLKNEYLNWAKQAKLL